MKADRELDCTGFYCPLPVVKTKLELEEMSSGEVLKVIADDPGAEKDFPAWCSETGNGLLRSDKDSGNFVFYIKKK